MNNLLITGVRGFLGSRLLEDINKNDLAYRTLVVDNMSSLLANHSTNCRIISWNELRSYENYQDWTIVHIANSADQEVNYGMLSALREFIEAVNTVNMVMLSSVAVYGSNPSCITKDTPPSPNTAYGRMKLYGEELLANAIEHKKNSSITAIRSSAILGRRMPATFVKRLHESMTDKKYIEVAHKGSLFNNCMHIDSMIELIKILITGSDKLRRVYVTGGLEPITIRELALMLSGESAEDFVLSESLLCEVASRKAFYIDEELILRLPMSVQVKTADHVLRYLHNQA